MVDCLTKEKYKGRILVILAGYNDDINRLLSVNRGLASRFPEEIVFTNMTPNQSLGLLTKILQGHKIELDNSRDADIVEAFRELCALSAWGNARDVQTLAKKMTAAALQSMDGNAPTSVIKFRGSDALLLMEEMLNGMTSRARVPNTTQRRTRTSPQDPMGGQQPPPYSQFGSTSTSTSASTNAPANASTSNTSSSATNSNTSGPASTSDPTAATNANAPRSPSPAQPADSDDAPRDPGVSDAIWNELQLRRRTAAVAALELAELKTAEEETKRLEAEVRENARRAAQLNKEEQQRAELLRIRAVAERAKRAQQAARLQRMEQQRSEEQRIQQKIRHMGVCPQGYQWIKHSMGYRCAGGSHHLSNLQLGI